MHAYDKIADVFISLLVAFVKNIGKLKNDMEFNVFGKILTLKIVHNFIEDIVTFFICLKKTAEIMILP